MTLGTFLQPPGLALAALLGWCFVVLSAAQLTVRLIMAYNVLVTLRGAVVLCALALLAALPYDAVVGSDPSVVLRLRWAPLSILLMALAGFATARWVLRIRRLRGQVVCAMMVGLLDPHLFTILSF